MTTERRRIAIIGAGPVGLEAALFAVRAGYRVDVYERSRVGDNIRRWGHVRLFSPFGLNASAWGRRALREFHDAKCTTRTPLPSREGLGEGPDAQVLPGGDDLLTGSEFVERYLLPLSRLPRLADYIHEQVEVCSIARSHCLKRDFIGKPERGRDPFRLLLRDRGGERVAFADCVLDCSGTFGNHNWAGAGGMPAVGETSALTGDNYLLPDITGCDHERFADKTTLVVGGGYSAATAVVALARLSESKPNTRAVWITRSKRREPIERIDGDALLERDSLAGIANRLATAATGPVEWRPGRLIVRIERSVANDGYRVELTCVGERRDAPHEELSVDCVIANVGYRPDRSLYEELQVHECYASGGPMKLAAALLGETSADCLSQVSPGPQALVNPEPGFFILGAKSYGRDSRFLINVGLQQIRDVFSLLPGERDA
ncbi:MAG: hypothetical protein WD648_08700 [Planctomycetaceae bacterium]